MSNTLFPIFLKTDTFRFLIVGGGNVGLEKANTLLRQNPLVHIKIVAKEINIELKKVLDNHSHLEWEERSYNHNDLESVDFVIIATGDAALNKKIKLEANSWGILVNAADQPDLCDFYLGSIVNKGALKIAISTNGKSPVLAKRMREYFTEVIPDDIDNSISLLNNFRNQHKGDFNQKLTDLNKATESFSFQKKEKKEERKYRKLVLEITILFMFLFIGFGLSKFITVDDVAHQLRQVPNAFYGMVLVGFFAQLIDGALGLGYGIVCATSMMLLGIKLPAISGSIHTAEMFSSGISGFTHYKFGNVNKKLFFWIAIPGVIGAVGGALLLTFLGNKYETITYGILASYTLLIGIRLITLAYAKKIERKKLKNTSLLGFTGGFLDAFGGGGWGPIVTSTLLSKGRKSNYVIGTVSLAEFFVTLAASITFFTALGISHWYVILGLIIGGVFAAPLGARLAGRLPHKTTLLLVAFLVITFSVRMLLKIL
jgi:uncharacterized protein